MAYSSTSNRQHAHELIDRMAPGQLSAVVGLMEKMLDPVARAIANATFDDEPVSDEERREISATRASDPNKSISNEQVLADFGLTTEDFERMGRTPLEPNEAR